MKILLVNSNRFKYPRPVIPTGLCLVAASIEQAGYEVFILDLCFSKNCAVDIRATISAVKPDIVGVYIRNIDDIGGNNTQFLLDDVKNSSIFNIKKYFRGPIVIGGPAVTISGIEILEFLDLEYAIYGDGEIVMVEFIRCLEEDERMLTELKGLIMRKKGKIVQNPAALPLQNLDLLPSLKPHQYLNLKPYRKFDSPIPIQTKRGCALKCIYCTYSQIEGSSYRYRSPELIAQEIELIVKETRMNHFEFTDSTFNLPLEHAKAVLRILKKKKMNLRLKAMGLNPAGVDEELVDLMHQTGFQEVVLAAEAGCDAILKDFRKNYTKESLLRAGELLKRRNIPILWCLLAGAPAETRETLQETFDTIIQAASPWDLIDVSVGVRAYKGSPLSETMICDNESFLNDRFLHPVYALPQKTCLYAIEEFVKQKAFRYSNVFVSDKRKNLPFFILRILFLLRKVFIPQQPVWRIYILLRNIRKWIRDKFTVI